MSSIQCSYWVDCYPGAPSKVILTNFRSYYRSFINNNAFFFFSLLPIINICFHCFQRKSRVRGSWCALHLMCWGAFFSVTLLKVLLFNRYLEEILQSWHRCLICLQYKCRQLNIRIFSISLFLFLRQTKRSCHSWMNSSTRENFCHVI